MNWLKERRSELHLSQDQLAKRLQLAGLNVTRSTVSGWENGWFSPPLKDADARRILADALGISVIELLRLAGFEVLTETEYSAAAQRAALIVEGLPPDKQRLALEILETFSKAR